MLVRQGLRSFEDKLDDVAVIYLNLEPFRACAIIVFCG